MRKRRAAGPDAPVAVSGEGGEWIGCKEGGSCGGEEPPVARRRVLSRKILFSRDTNLSPSISCAGRSQTGDAQSVAQEGAPWRAPH